jgi:hypothetical protein
MMRVGALVCGTDRLLQCGVAPGRSTMTAIDFVPGAGFPITACTTSIARHAANLPGGRLGRRAS